MRRKIADPYISPHHCYLSKSALSTPNLSIADSEMIAYRCFAVEREAGARLLSAVSEFAADKLLLSDVGTLHAASGRTLGLRRRENSALLQLQTLNANEKEILRSFGELANFCLSFTPIENTPGSLNLCWELMIAINAFAPTSVWLSSETYRAESIHPFAPSRAVRFSDAREGFLLFSREFGALLDSSG